MEVAEAAHKSDARIMHHISNGDVTVITSIVAGLSAVVSAIVTGFITYRITNRQCDG